LYEPIREVLKYEQVVGRKPLARRVIEQDSFESWTTSGRGTRAVPNIEFHILCRAADL